MIDTMPRPRPPYLHREKTRHGRVVWYVRKGDGPRVRIPGEYGSPEFTAAYQAAVSGEPVAATGTRNTRGAFDWLCGLYRESDEWRSLAPSTRYKQDKIFKQVSTADDAVRVDEITKAAIVAGRDRRKATPNQARHYLDALRGLFGWAARNTDTTGVLDDPTDGVKNLTIPKTAGFKVWTEADIAAFEARWPRGTRERVWLDLVQYTGLRRGDAVRLGPEHVGEGLFSIATEKSRFQTVAHVPILADLWETLEAGPVGAERFIINANGAPFTKESFGNAFSDAARKAGVVKSLHGLRKTAATRSAEKSATTEELKALFGWESDRMAAVYTKSASRKRMAANAADKIGKQKMAKILPMRTNGRKS